MGIILTGYNIVPKFLRTDRSWRVEIDVSEDQQEEIKKLIGLPNGVFKITIEPQIET